MLTASPTVAERQRLLTGTIYRIYCLVTEVHVCEQLAYSCDLKAESMRVGPVTSESWSYCLTITLKGCICHVTIGGSVFAPVFYLRIVQSFHKSTPIASRSFINSS